jgi:hypothetical protein
LARIVDRQSIHIRTQPDRRAIADPKNADHTGLANVTMDLTAELCELTGDELGGAMLLETEFGMRVQVLPSCRHLGVKQREEMWDLHDDRLHGMLKFEASTLGDAQN